MFVEHIEKLKREYTDKYVAVDAKRPELARFKDVVGKVKTVNMSGRALVEFTEYHLNIGWYDIDIDFLKVVDKPQPKTEEKAKKPAAKPAAKAKPAAPAAEKKLSPLEMARAMDAKKKGAAGKEAAPSKPAAAAPSKPAAQSKGKMSTADILAAARGETSAAALSAPAKEKPEKPAPAPGNKAPAVATTESAKVDGPKLTVEQMLAMARAEKSGEKPAPAADVAAQQDSPTSVDPSDLTQEESIAIAKARGEADDASESTPATPAVERRKTEETVQTDVTEGEVVATDVPAHSTEKTDRSQMSVDDMLAWCREHDGG